MCNLIIIICSWIVGDCVAKNQDLKAFSSFMKNTLFSLNFSPQITESGT